MKGENTLLFYFTATGNSLYVAKQLENDPISIPQELRKANRHYISDSIGIVCPLFEFEIPNLVKDFIQGSSFETDYFYLFITSPVRIPCRLQLSKCKGYSLKCGHPFQRRVYFPCSAPPFACGNPCSFLYHHKLTGKSTFLQTRRGTTYYPFVLY